LSGVPPAAGGAAGVAGAGAGVCARANEPVAATAQAASVIETIERIIFSQLKFVCTLDHDATRLNRIMI
jgi:hypothetical protein